MQLFSLMFAAAKMLFWIGTYSVSTATLFMNTWYQEIFTAHVPSVRAGWQPRLRKWLSATGSALQSLRT